jgi:hypothetical protein
MVGVVVVAVVVVVALVVIITDAAAAATWVLLLLLLLMLLLLRLVLALAILLADGVENAGFLVPETTGRAATKQQRIVSVLLLSSNMEITDTPRIDVASRIVASNESCGEIFLFILRVPL